MFPYDGFCFVPYFLWPITAVTPCFPLSGCTKYSARGRRMKGKKMYMDQGSRSSGSASVWIWLAPTLSWLGIYTHLCQAGLCRMWTPNDEEEAINQIVRFRYNYVEYVVLIPAGCREFRFHACSYHGPGKAVNL